ncbi:hypothetical protein [Anaeromicropila herbilytica]|uniref:Uncharacterized protein n=1 Tax=Anaeromicropila herbilytica TaxID=2785025 RepID=A0A7R7IC74_9FIRM|nr:hypothetical protein [Anaeromicropila herbilytica]BCN30292.1 hypothetical protein bsdtb5_15870 [Anaeromicropila herbilytica]
MKKKWIEDINKLEKLADEAGGYVVNINELKKDKKESKKFIAIRKYCIANKKNYQDLNESDFKKIGIHPKK